MYSPSAGAARGLPSGLAMSCRTLIAAASLAGAGILNAEIIAGQNLLTNGSATEAVATGWTVIANGGSGWATGGGGYDSDGGYFITSYGLCQRSQTIDLLAKGATAAELDAAPPISVSEAISMYNGSGNNNGVGDTYYLKVELRNAAGTAVASWNVGTATALAGATTSWVVQSHEFRGYGPGVRSVYFEDGGSDAGFWNGSYGTWHDAATVAFANQPVTDITLTPAAFPSNVPAGGLAGQLRAVDADNLTHTFTLEPEVTTTARNLLTAGAAGWRYYDTGVAPAANWMAGDFDDSAWGTGPAPLGYDSGNADTWQATKVSYGADAAAKPFTTWFRKAFAVADPAVITALQATLMIDDGCVVYLNGQELFRDGVADGIAVTDTTPANRGVSGGDESDYDPVTITPDKLTLLLSGTNVLAVEVHQQAITSSDISLDMTLSATDGSSVNSYSNDLFEIAGTELRVKNGSAVLAPGDYTVRVKATDAAGNACVKLLAVQRTNAVFTAAPASLDLAPAPATVAENASAGTLLGTFSTTDADSGDAHGYTLVSGAGGTDNALVAIAGNRLLVAQSPDYELRSALSVLVKVTDSAGLSFTRTFSIAVTDDTAEDQDGDGLTEAEEDLNNDGILDANETDPLLADTDGDTYNDRIERNAGSNPRDPASLPSVIELRQTVTHTTGDSWLKAGTWEGGVVPDASHFAITDNLTLRPPPVADPVFPGAAMDLRNGAIFRLKHTGQASVSRIILRNAMIQQGMTVPISVGGAGARLEVPVSGTLDTAAVELDLRAALSGAGTIKVIGTAAGRLQLESPADGFTGELWLENPEVVLTDAAAAGSARRLAVKSGTLRTAANTLLPATVLQRSGTGRIGLSHSVTVGDFVVDGAVIPAGSYNAAALSALGVPAAALDDAGGTLIVAGTRATSDADGDGASDLFEILAQTDPASSADWLHLSSVSSVGGGVFRLEWTAVPGVTYTVQSSTALDGPWQDLAAVTATSTAGAYNAVIPAPQPLTTFFRLALK